MHIEFVIDWAWWQWFLALLGAAYLCGGAFFLLNGAGLKVAALWPFSMLGWVVAYLAGWRG